MEHIVDAFSTSKRWSKIVGIVLAILLALQLLITVINFFVTFAAGAGGDASTGAFIIVVAITLLIIGSNLFASICLIRYADSVNEAENASDPTESIEIACLHQGRYFKYISIAALAMTIMMGIIIIAMMVFSSYFFST